MYSQNIILIFKQKTGDLLVLQSLYIHPLHHYDIPQMQRFIDSLLRGKVRLRTDKPTCRSKDALLFLSIFNIVLFNHFSKLTCITHSILKRKRWIPTGNFASSHHEFFQTVIHCFLLILKIDKEYTITCGIIATVFFYVCKKYHGRESVVTHYGDYPIIFYLKLKYQILLVVTINYRFFTDKRNRSMS